MRVFLCHRSVDSARVIEVARHLVPCLDSVFYYEEHQRADSAFQDTVSAALAECEAVVIFIGEGFCDSDYCLAEARDAFDSRKPIVVVLLAGVDALPTKVRTELNVKARVDVQPEDSASKVAKEIVRLLGITWVGVDGLPADPHLFDYEKDIIRFYGDQSSFGDRLFQEQGDVDLEAKAQAMRDKLLAGCPAQWPEVVRWEALSKNELVGAEGIGVKRDTGAKVMTTALSTKQESSKELEAQALDLTLPEAGPRDRLYFPREGPGLNVRILVSGGIAPGINAVIDGIVQRHWQYAEAHRVNAGLDIRGIRYGFKDLGVGQADDHVWLAASPNHYLGQHPRLEVAGHVHEGGSMLGISRDDDLIRPKKRMERLRRIVARLDLVDILYVIGGDGSMKAAHSIWKLAQETDRAEHRPLSVVAIPKTMDNDILWAWQSFGFLSAVEKAREIIEALSIEVASNPRLCVVQLFGSESGFVVSHAVLASPSGTCALALIPEVPFSIEQTARILRGKMWEANPRTPQALVVLAETAIPVDAALYAGDESNPNRAPKIDIGLSLDERQAIWQFENNGRRFQGQTNDHLRSAGLKIVTRGLSRLLPKVQTEPKHKSLLWDRLRVFTNEPRHLLRTIRPSSSDVIFGQRLGVLAVDNAMAGYTDFMVSQWLTEYVLVPLDLVVLGRKRIPRQGIFWKSVLAKTGQPARLTT